MSGKGVDRVRGISDEREPRLYDARHAHQAQRKGCARRKQRKGAKTASTCLGDALAEGIVVEREQTVRDFIGR